MRKISIILIVILAGMIFMPASAQNNLSESDKRELQDRVKSHVESFLRYLGDLVNTGLSDTRRQASIKSALALFIGKGEPYFIINENGIREEHREVRMQVSSANSKYVSAMSMKNYLNNQYKNIHKYGKVEITAADMVRVDNIYKVGNGKYQAVAYFYQKYIAYMDGRIVYGDKTTKKVIVHINAIETPVGITWEAKLGDIYVTSTKRTR